MSPSFCTNLGFFVSVDAFNKKNTTFYNKHRHYPTAEKFIDEKLISNKEKNVAFFTKHVFTAGSFLKDLEL